MSRLQAVSLPDVNERLAAVPDLKDGDDTWTRRATQSLGTVDHVKSWLVWITSLLDVKASSFGDDERQRRPVDGASTLIGRSVGPARQRGRLPEREV